MESLNAKYEALLLNADEETADKLQALIATTNELIHDYTLYENGTRGSFHQIYSAEVTAATEGGNKRRTEPKFIENEMQGNAYR